MSLENLSYSDVEEIIKEKLKIGGKVRIKPNGTSMLPLLRPGEDEVELVKNPARLKKYDIAFYKRKSGQFVLHRVIKVRKKDYVFCGDAHFNLETGITDDMIIAVVSGFYKDGKYISVSDKEYVKYSKNRVMNRNLRKLTSRLRKIKKFFKDEKKA